MRYPYSPGLVDESAIPRLHKAFYAWLPIVEPGLEGTVLVAPQFAATPATATARQLRFLSRDRRFAVLVTPTQVSVETTAYRSYEEFREGVRRAFEALAGISPQPSGMARIGLRYVDEVRVEGIGKEPLTAWDGLIDRRLLAAGSLNVDGKLTSLQGVLQFDCGDSRRVVMRYGAVQGQSVRNEPLRLDVAPKTGPYFLIDVDSYWTGGEPVPEFRADHALKVCDTLHQPTRQLFEASITERLRGVFRGSAPKGGRRGAN
jgi:uncharacterized protein (TIGR04255 family)